ncbi:MAG: hypothetical protein ACI9EF_000218 [Pseudohongiellaceae bacterium]|jgi:hypothetical protein
MNMCKRTSVAFATVCLIGLCGPAIQASVIYVDNSHTGPFQGTLTNPYAKLTTAMQNATAGDAIRVAKGNKTYNIADNGETYPLDLKSEVDIRGFGIGEANYPSVGGDVNDSAVKGGFRAEAFTGSITGVYISKIRFVAEDSSGKDAPSAVSLAVKSGESLDVELVSCVFERSEMNDGSSADKPSLLALVGEGSCDLTVDQSTIEPNEAGGIELDAGLETGFSEASTQDLTVSHCTFSLGTSEAAAYAIRHFVTADNCDDTSGNDLFRNVIDSRSASSPYGFSQGIVLGSKGLNSGVATMLKTYNSVWRNLIAGCRNDGLSFLIETDANIDSDASVRCWEVNQNEIRENGSAGILIDLGDGLDPYGYFNVRTNSNLIVENDVGMEIVGFSSLPAIQLQMMNDTVAYNTGYGLEMDNSVIVTDVENSLFWYNNSGGAQYGGTGGWAYTGAFCFSYNNWQGSPSSVLGNIDSVPEFVDYLNGDYHLAACA